MRVAMFQLFKPYRSCVEDDREQWFQRNFELALGDINRDASVGKGVMSRYGATIGVALGWNGELCRYDPMRLQHLANLLRYKIAQIEAGTYQPDPINVFVKAEPHKDAKISEGRFRLIMAVSMEDTFLDRMLYRDIYVAALKQWKDVPVKLGYSPLRNMFSLLEASFPGKSMSIDKKAWDFSVKPWMILAWRQFLEDMYGAGPPWWIKLHRARFTALFGPDCLYEFPDGARAKQKRWGIMKSGCYLTILLNSIGQVMLAWIARHRLGLDLGVFWTVGDDTLEESIEEWQEYVEHLKQLGCEVKEVAITDHIEFCGFLVANRQVRPAYHAKHLFKLFYEGGEHYKEKLEMYLFLYAFNPDMYRIMEPIYRMEYGMRPPPADMLQAIWRGVY